MVLKHEVSLSDDLMVRCWEHGQKIVDGYAAGHNSGSRAVSSRGAENNSELQARAKMAEVAFCVRVGLDPITCLNWSSHSDVGYDVLFNNYRVDVKHIDQPFKKLLIWPTNKREFFLEVPVDVFVLVRGEGPTFLIHRWIDREGFWSLKKEVSCPTAKLDQGTWYVEDRDMWEMDRLFELTRHRAA